MILPNIVAVLEAWLNIYIHVRCVKPPADGASEHSLIELWLQWAGLWGKWKKGSLSSLYYCIVFLYCIIVHGQSAGITTWV